MQATVFLSIPSPPSRARLLFVAMGPAPPSVEPPALLERLGQDLHRLLPLLVVEAEDLLQADPDVGDVLLDVGALPELVDELAPLAEVGRQAPPDLLEREADLARDLGIARDRLLRLRGEGDPDRGHVDEQDRGPHGERAAGLLEAVGLPVRRDDRLRHGAGRLLVEEGDAVREAQEPDRLVRLGEERLVRLLLRQLPALPAPPVRLDPKRPR